MLPSRNRLIFCLIFHRMHFAAISIHARIPHLLIYFCWMWKYLDWLWHWDNCYFKYVMNGCVLPYTPIAIDFWKVRQCPRVRLFFLSHVHLEPSCGITPGWSLPIYCSPLSKKLLIHQFQVIALLLFYCLAKLFFINQWQIYYLLCCLSLIDGQNTVFSEESLLMNFLFRYLLLSFEKKLCYVYDIRFCRTAVPDNIALSYWTVFNFLSKVAVTAMLST
jgi:hypothetical protein